jgi:ribosomal protein S16
MGESINKSKTFPGAVSSAFGVMKNKDARDARPLELDGNYLPAMISLAQAYETLGMRVDAQRILDMIVAGYPHSNEARSAHAIPGFPFVPAHEL